MKKLRTADGKIRVLVNALHSKSGGGVTYLLNVIPNLAKQPNLELHVMVHRNQLDRFEGLCGHARLHPMNFTDNMIMTQLWEQLVLPIVARVMGVDVVFSPANYGPLAVNPSVVLVANSLAVATKEARPGKLLYWIVLGAMTITSLARARRILSVSHYATDSILRGPLSFLKRKVRVTHLGVSSHFSPSAEPRQNFLLAVGDIYIQKNYQTLLRAMSLLRDKHPELNLRIAGKPLDPKYLQGLNRQIDELGLKDCVTFLGHCDTETLIKNYRQCKIFVFPSTVETFGIPLVEAMACGCAIAGSNRAAMPEIADDAMDYFNPEDPISVATVIDNLLGDEARQKELAARALERAKHFTWEHNAQLTSDILVAAVD